MKFKFSFALLTFSIALFASGRFERFITHSQSCGNVVWAQDATDTEQDADVSSEPSATPPDVQGTWSGPIVDSSAGTTTHTIDIFQNKSKTKSTLSAPIAGWSVNDNVSSDGITVLFKVKVHHGR